MAFCVSVHVGSGYLLAVIGGILHTQQFSVGPSVQIGVLSTDAPVAGVPWLALASEHGLSEDSQVDAVCIFMAVMAAILARITRSAHLKKITEG